MPELLGLVVHQSSRESERAVVGKAVLESEGKAGVVEGRLRGSVVVAVATFES